MKNKIFFNVKDAKDIGDQPLELKKEDEDNDETTEQTNISMATLNREPEKKIVDDGLIPMTFTYKFEKGKQPKSVLLCGSFSKWTEKYPLTFDPLSDKWSITIKLEKGKHLYKYIVNDEWIINPLEQSAKGNDGIINNVVEI